MVTSYIENGPEWVTNQLDKQIKSLLEDVNSAIDKQWQKDKEVYDSKAQSLGEKLGQEMTEKYNDALQKAQKKGIEKINKTKTKASLKLCSSKAKAASLIASKTGIYIPI
jgi:F0F1-type ATP synthase membrane subunit b/b'